MKSEINDVPISNNGYVDRKSEMNDFQLANDGRTHTTEHPKYSEMGESKAPKPKPKSKAFNLSLLKVFVAVAASISVLQIGVYIPIISDFFDEAVAPVPAVAPPASAAPTVTVSFANLIVDETGVKGDINTTVDIGTIDVSTLFYYLYLYLGTSYSSTGAMIKGPDYLVSNSINFNFGGLVSNTNYYLVVLDSMGNEIVGQAIKTDKALSVEGANVFCEGGQTKIQLNFVDDFGYWSSFYVELYNSIGVITMMISDDRMHEINQFPVTIMASDTYTLDVYCITTEPGRESDNDTQKGEDGAHRWLMYSGSYDLDKFA